LKYNSYQALFSGLNLPKKLMLKQNQVVFCPD